MEIHLMRGMVEDGAAPPLEVGDTWQVDLMFQPDVPMARTTQDFEVGMWPVASRAAFFSSRYHVRADVRRRHARGERREGAALALPGVMLGCDSTFPLLDGQRVQGTGIIRVDPWSNSSWIFPETRRRCTVERLTCINASPIGTEGGWSSSWARVERRQIERIRVVEDFAKDQSDGGFYSVEIALL